MTIRRLHSGPRMSQAVVCNGLVFLAGQVAEDTGQDVGGQTRQVLAAIDRLLAEAGSDKSRLLAATIYLKEIQDSAAMNSVWEAWMPAGCAPARTTVEAHLAAPELRVEITAVAAA